MVHGTTRTLKEVTVTLVACVKVNSLAPSRSSRVLVRACRGRERVVDRVEILRRGVLAANGSGREKGWRDGEDRFHGAVLIVFAPFDPFPQALRSVANAEVLVLMEDDSVTDEV